MSSQTAFLDNFVASVFTFKANDKNEAHIGIKVKKRYKKMLKGMRKKEETGVHSSEERWFLYILECSDGTLYTGITKDLERRIEQHNAGKASRYTRVRRPVKLAYNEVCSTRTAALVRECKVKEMTRKNKLSLLKLIDS